MRGSLGTFDLPPLSVRADVRSVDADARTAELIFSTGAAVDRIDWWTGKRFIEILSMKPNHVHLERLNAGAPLLDSHSGTSVAHQLGAVQRGTARIQNGLGILTARFSKRAEVEPIFRDVEDGIITAVSVGYRVRRFEETTTRGSDIPTRTATDWEPFEVSLVPMPADVGARVRDGDKTQTNPCVIVRATADEDRVRRFRWARMSGFQA